MELLERLLLYQHCLYLLIAMLIMELLHNVLDLSFGFLFLNCDELIELYLLQLLLGKGTLAQLLP